MRPARKEVVDRMRGQPALGTEVAGGQADPLAVVIQTNAVARPELRHDGAVVPGQARLLASNLRRWGEKDLTGGLGRTGRWLCGFHGVWFCIHWGE